MTALRLTLAAAALAALPTVAGAQTATPADPAAPATTTPAPATTATTAAPATTGGRIGVAKALEAAKGRIDGGILEAELETDDGQEIWEVDVAMGDSVHEVKVNALSGEVISAEEKTIEGTWRSWFDEESLTQSQAISGTLSATIAKAEGEAGGTITNLELDEEDGKLVYELEVDTTDGEKDMVLDPATGMVTPDA